MALIRSNQIQSLDAAKIITSKDRCFVTQDILDAINNGTIGGGGSGTNGKDGKSLEFNWQGTSLGIRVEGEPDFQYVDLKGRDGLNGQDGIDGVNGRDGVDGQDGVDGRDGADGLSAYQIAVNNGFNGSEQEWLESLKGTGSGNVDLTDYATKDFVANEIAKVPTIKGDKGDTGEKGEKGDKGEQGLQGPRGEKGDSFTIKKVYPSISDMNSDYSNTDVTVGEFVIITTGNVEDEDNAKLYIKGETQYDFITDMSGANGIQGPKGDQGPQGIQGIQGADGANGLDGTNGVDGREAEFIVEGNILKWRYAGETDWIELLDLNGVGGSGSTNDLELTDEDIESIINGIVH